MQQMETQHYQAATNEVAYLYRQRMAMPGAFDLEVLDGILAEIDGYSAKAPNYRRQQWLQTLRQAALDFQREIYDGPAQPLTKKMVQKLKGLKLAA